MDQRPHDRNARDHLAPEEWDDDPALSELVSVLRASAATETPQPSDDLRALFSQGRPTPIRPELVDDPFLARSRRARAVAVVTGGAIAGKLLLGGAAAAATLGTLQVTGAVDVVHLTGLDKIPAIWESDDPETTDSTPIADVPSDPAPGQQDQPANRPDVPPGQDDQPGNRPDTPPSTSPAPPPGPPTDPGNAPDVPPGQTGDTPGNAPDVPPGQTGDTPGNAPDVPPGQTGDTPGNAPDGPPGQTGDTPGNAPDGPPGQTDDTTVDTPDDTARPGRP